MILLIDNYDIEYIVNVGSAGSANNDLKIGIVTTNLFNEEEMQKIIKESSKANLSPKEYISNKILK